MTKTTLSQPEQPIPKNQFWILFLSIATYRILNALLIQTQFDPDETWQTLEPAYCLAFSSSSQNHNCAYTWEWTRHNLQQQQEEEEQSTLYQFLQNAMEGPVRSHLNILPTFYLYKLLHYFHLDTTWMISKSPLLLNALLVSTPVDVSIYLLSRWMIINKHASDTTFSSLPFWSLILSLSNWFHGYGLIRTYSNSVECMFLMVGMALVAPELFSDVTRKSFTIRPKAALAFILGGMSVAIRFTSLAAWIPLGLIITLRQSNRKDLLFCFWGLCVCFGSLGLCIGCIVDRYFYGFWAIPFLGSFHFNVLLGNGSLYGTHPWYWYILIGLPAISGILFPFFLWNTKNILFSSQDNKQHSLYQQQKKLLVIIISYLVLHSISSHKEFRFILPILPLVCIIASHGITQFLYSKTHIQQPTQEYVQKSTKSKIVVLSTLIFLLNIPHFLFLSLIHQRSPIEVNKGIINHIQKDEHQTNYTIHYLMGCHSTPLYSHLHIPTTSNRKDINIKAWTLDCSPECRSNDSELPCESSLFQANPRSFLAEKYFSQESTTDGDSSMDTDAEDYTCGKNDQCLHNENIPNIIAIFNHEYNAPGVRDVILDRLSFKEIGRYRHSISGISIFTGEVDLNSPTDENNSFTLKIFSGVSIHFDYMILLTR